MNLLSSLLKYTADQIAALRAKNTSQDTTVSGIDTRLSTAETKVTNMEAQLATAIGAVTVDSEVQNIRVGDDNVTYASAGEAVRTQFSNVKSALNLVNDGKRYLPDYKIIKDQYVQYNGVISNYNGWDRTDYLEVTPNEKLFYFSQNNLSYVKFYNSNKEPISVDATITVYSSQTEYIVPNDSRIKYWIVSGSASDMAAFKIWRNSPLINDTTVNSNKTYSSSKIESLLSSVAKTNLINRFNKATIEEGHFLSTADGSLSVNSDFFASDFIDVHDLDKVKCSYTHIVCFYDANKTFVSGQGFNTNSADAFIDRPSNAYYFRFSNYNDYIDSAQIGENVSREDYVPYGKYSLDGLVLTNDTIVVDVSGDGDYTSLTEALYENVDSGEDIVVKAGTYNIVAEYVDLFGQSAVDNMADSDGSTFNGFQYGVIIRNRKITFEAGAHIVCDWTGHTVNGTHRFSALRVDYNAEIIGLDLVATATFYAIHDDYGINAPYTVKYENCRVKGINLYNSNCIGGGCKSYSRHILKNCYFDNGVTESATVRYHNTNAEGAEPEIFVSNCYFNNWFTPRWYGTQTSKMRVYVNNCEARAIYKLAESSSYNVDNVELYKWCNVETNPVT